MCLCYTHNTIQRYANVSLLIQLPHRTIRLTCFLQHEQLETMDTQHEMFLSVNLKTATVLPILLLQKPSKKSKTKDHIKCLERRLANWSNGDLEELVKESRTLQHRLPSNGSSFTKMNSQAVIDSNEYVEEYVNSKVRAWSSSINILRDITKSQLQAAFSALTHGLLNKWTYFSHVV